MEKYHKNDVVPVERENERDENYISDNPQIDRARTKDNYRLVSSCGTYTEFINNRLKELNLSPRKDAVVMNSFVVGSDKLFSINCPKHCNTNSLRTAQNFLRNATGKKI